MKRLSFFFLQLLFFFLFPNSLPFGENWGGVLAQSLSDAIKLTESEQFEKAADTYKLLIQNELTNGDNYFFYGENYFIQELINSSFEPIDLDSAQLLYEKGIQKNPGNPINYVGLGKIFWYKENSSEAKKKFYDAVQIISPTNKTASFTKKQKALVYLKIAECYTKAKTKDLQEAINLLNKSLQEDPNNPETYILIGDATLEQNPGDATQAIAQYKKAFDLDKKSTKALQRIGQLYGRAKNLSEALRNYQEALKIDPNFAPAYREIAELYYRVNQYDAAITNYKKYLELNNGSISARVRYSSFLFLSKKYTETVTNIKEIQKQNQDIPFLYRILAYSYFETDNYADGLTAIEQFFAKTSEKKILASDYEYYGKLLFKLGKDSLAIEKLKIAIQQDTSKTELNGEIGSSYMKMKKYPEAIDNYNKKIKGGQGIDVNDYYNLGRAYIYTTQFGKADTAFMQIIILRPDISTGYLWRAKANFMIDPKNEKFLAKPFFEEFLNKLKPEEIEKNKNNVIQSNEYLGFYYFVQKDYAKSKCHWQKVKEMEPSNEKAKKALADTNITRVSCTPN
ncbi:MAG: tetratricopeptide repeat protein [Bacteroidota bacterium]